MLTTQAIIGYILTLALAVHQGFFNGGYVTLLTIDRCLGCVFT